MEEKSDKKEYEMLKELNEKLTNFNANEQKNMKEKYERKDADKER